MFNKINKILNKNQKIKIYLLFLVSFPLIFLETISIGSLPVYILTIINPESIINFFDKDALTNFLNNMSIEQRALYGLILIIILK